MIATRTLKLAPLALALAFVSACGVRTKTTDISAVTRPPTCDEAVDVYTSRSMVPHDYYELAFIEAEGNSVYTSDGKIVAQIRKKAAEVGANAIIANSAQEANSTVKVLGEALGTQSATTKTSALAVYMPAEADRVAVKCGR